MYYQYFYSPPNGCLQYHTGIDGRFTTFNYDNPTTAQQTHLRNQNYRICIRQEEGTISPSTLSMNIIKIDQIKSYLSLGYCCVLFMQCSSTTFRINNAGIAAFTTAKVGTNCSEDYIGIEGIYRKSCHIEKEGTSVCIYIHVFFWCL